MYAKRSFTLPRNSLSTADPLQVAHVGGLAGAIPGQRRYAVRVTGSVLGPTASGSIARQYASLRRYTSRLSQELASARRIAAEATYAANHEPLTGLYNRRGLTAAWTTVAPTGLLLLDLDGFKPVNDRYGHAAGDQVLATIASRLARAGAIAGRLGGDEFVLITADADPVALAQRVAQLVAAPIPLDGAAVAVTASVGVRTVDGPAEFGQVLADADRAMYAAKATGSRVVVWTPTLAAPVLPQPARLRDMHPRPATPAVLISDRW